MTRGDGAAYRLSAFVLLISSATGLAQQPDRVSFDADSVSLDLRRSSSVFTGLTVADATVTVNAAEGTTTNENGNDGLWELRSGLRIAMDMATLTADSGTFRFAGGRFTEIELLGDPVTLEGPVGSELRQFRLTAGRVAYDGARRVLQASQSVVFVSDGLEVRNCSWTYKLSDKSVQALPETSSKCMATVLMNRTAAD